MRDVTCSVAITGNRQTSCCAAHDLVFRCGGCVNSSQLGAVFQSIYVVHRGINTLVGVDSLGDTEALRSAIENQQQSNTTSLPPPLARGVLYISSLKLCRTHQNEGRCKMGSRCRNFHLCRAVMLRETGPTPVTLPPITPTAKPVAVRDSMEELLSAIPNFCCSPTPPTSSHGLAPQPPSSATLTCLPLSRFARRWHHPQTSTTYSWEDADGRVDLRKLENILKVKSIPQPPLLLSTTPLETAVKRPSQHFVRSRDAFFSIM